MEYTVLRKSGLLGMVLMVLGCSAVKAQPALSQDKKAIKYYQEGEMCFREQNYTCAEEKLSKAVERDPNFPNALALYAVVLEGRGAYEEATKHYQQIINTRPEFHSTIFLSLADLELRLQRFDAAERNYNTFLKRYRGKGQKLIWKARRGLENVEFAREAVKSPVPYEAINMGPNINTADPEYFPCVTADYQSFYFTRMIKNEEAYQGMHEDFFVTYKAEQEWAEAVNLGKPLNSLHNEGAGTIAPDGQILVFTACQDVMGQYMDGQQGYGSCDLFYTMKSGSSWTKPRNMGKGINSSHWESQPSLSSDGRTLYFVRGTTYIDGRQLATPDYHDIYMAELGEDGKWGKPEKLSKQINTPGREVSVFIHPDGRTLYFSSNGHPGMGGEDIFMSTRQADGTWSTPKNLGYPINTADHENSILVSPDGDLAFFASDKKGGYGDLDLYYYTLPEHAKPAKISYFKGHTFDEETSKSISARFQLFDLETGELVVESYSNPGNGEFLLTLPVGKNYALNVSRKGYSMYSETFEMKANENGEPMKKDVGLTPIKEGAIVVLKNVFFETAKSELLPKSRVELDKVVEYLTKNADIKVEFGGHTDNVGKDEDNQVLSEARAKAVMDYVVGKGIDAGRISAKGYGEKKPVATNDTPEGRAENRRTEMKIVQ